MCIHTDKYTISRNRLSHSIQSRDILTPHSHVVHYSPTKYLVEVLLVEVLLVEVLLVEVLLVEVLLVEVLVAFFVKSPSVHIYYLLFEDHGDANTRLIVLSTCTVQIRVHSIIQHFRDYINKTLRNNNFTIYSFARRKKLKKI
jgi:hypothetical protein